MEKQERRFIKFIGKKILEVLESYNCRYSDELWVYEEEALFSERFNDIEYFIQWAKDRGVNNSVIEYLNSMNEVLYNGKNFIF